MWLAMRVIVAPSSFPCSIVEDFELHKEYRDPSTIDRKLRSYPRQSIEHIFEIDDISRHGCSPLLLQFYHATFPAGRDAGAIHIV